MPTHRYSLNLGTLRTNGIDLQTSYTINVGEHRFGLNLVGTFLTEYSNAPLPGSRHTTAWASTVDTCGVPAPEWRHTFRTNWRTPWAGLDLAAAWRYYGEANSERLSTNPQLSVRSMPMALPTGVPAYSYLDLTASMTFAEKFTFRVGANNVLDKSPPIIPSGGVEWTARPVLATATPGRRYYDSDGSPDLRGSDVDF